MHFPAGAAARLAQPLLKKSLGYAGFVTSLGAKETYMSIGMQRFGSEGHFATYDRFAQPEERAAIFQLQCRCCGFEPEDVVVPPRCCPKCHGEAWERFARPGSILSNANRY